VDQLLDNPMILGAGVLVVAALGGLGFSAWKRKKGGSKARPAEDTAQPLDTADTFGPAGFAPVSGAGVATAASAVQAATGTLGDESDALAEAEVFLIYGRDAQAEERLKEAISVNPTRYELHAKLLEIYAKRGDADAFEKVATELQQGTGGEGDLWQKAVQMGYQIDATNPRYAAGRIDEDSAEKTVPGGDDEATVQMPAFDAAPRDDLDFNLDFESTTTGSSTDIDLGQLGADLERSGTTTTDIDLGLLGDGGSAPDVFDPSKTITRLDAGDPLAQTSEMAAFDPTATFAPVGDDDLDSNASAMGDFDPTVALPPVSDFDPTATIAPSEASDLPTLPGLSLAAQGQQAAADGGLDFDLGTEDTEATIGGTRRMPQMSSALDDVSFDLDTLKLDSSPMEETSPGMMPPRTIPESDLESTRPGTDSATDLDLSGISLDLGDVESPTVFPSGAKDEKWYDVQTKFDLAKAYQEMGDKEGAREILEEVIAEGDEGQQAAARDLLDSLGN
jgi:pilus assembly protein FimV